MKKLLSIFILLSLLACKKDENPTSNVIAGITYNSYQYNPNFISTPDSLVSINFSNGNLSNIGAVKNFKGLSDIRHQTRSLNKNLYIYHSSNLKIGFIDLLTNKQELISLGNDTTLYRIISLLVDETDNTLYMVSISYNYQTGKDWLGIIPVSLTSMEVLPKVNFMLAPAIDSYCVSDINFHSKEIFLKPNQGDSLYVLNYQTNSLHTLIFDKVLFDLHFNDSRNCLFGSGFSKNKFGLFELSLSTGSVNMIGEYSEIQAMGMNGNYYNKNDNSYWLMGLKQNSLNYQLINIDLANALITKSLPISKQLQFIN